MTDTTNVDLPVVAYVIELIRERDTMTVQFFAQVLKPREYYAQRLLTAADDGVDPAYPPRFFYEQLVSVRSSAFSYEDSQGPHKPAYRTVRYFSLFIDHLLSLPVEQSCALIDRMVELSNYKKPSWY